jgi:hypothetical protein
MSLCLQPAHDVGADAPGPTDDHDLHEVPPVVVGHLDDRPRGPPRASVGHPSRVPGVRTRATHGRGE